MGKLLEELVKGLAGVGFAHKSLTDEEAPEASGAELFYCLRVGDAALAYEDGGDITDPTPAFGHPSP